MIRNQNPVFDYTKEPSRDILCIDCKSFYASVECAERHLDPLTTKLVVMSYPSGKTDERGSGLILAASPAAKSLSYYKYQSSKRFTLSLSRRSLYGPSTNGLLHEKKYRDQCYL